MAKTLVLYFDSCGCISFFWASSLTQISLVFRFSGGLCFFICWTLFVAREWRWVLTFEYFFNKKLRVWVLLESSHSFQKWMQTLNRRSLRLDKICNISLFGVAFGVFEYFWILLFFKWIIIYLSSGAIRLRTCIVIQSLYPRRTVSRSHFYIDTTLVHL